MAKKKRQDNDFNDDFQLDSDTSVPEEEPMEEDEDGDESESEDVYAEDESDIVTLRRLEDKDREQALAEFHFDEEVGFNPLFDWSTVAEAETTRFQSLMAMTNDELETYKYDRLSNFQKWMVARACAKNGMHEMFQKITMGLVKSKKTTPELCMEDLYLELISDNLETRSYDAALENLDAFEKRFQDETLVALRVRGLIYIAMSIPVREKAKAMDDEGLALCAAKHYNEGRAMRLDAKAELEKADELVSQGQRYIDQMMNTPFHVEGYDEHVDDKDKQDGVLYYEVGYALFNMKMYDLAIHYFERAKNYSSLSDNYELTMAIDNARNAVHKAMQVE